MMRWSLLASGIFGLVAAFAPTWELLLTMRGLLGVTLAGLPVAALAYLREEVAAGSHTKANAAYIAGTAVGGAVGRLLPVPLAAIGGWPLAATVMSLVTLAAGAATINAPIKTGVAITLTAIAGPVTLGGLGAASFGVAGTGTDSFTWTATNPT